MNGVPNMYHVTDNIYRSGQPTNEGFKNLDGFGIKTVVNLRKWHKDNLTGTSLREVRIKMQAWDPDIYEVAQALSVILDDSDGPYLLHCQHGSDRTGTVIAAYRIVEQGWSKREAIREMTEGPYGFHEIWTQLPAFLDSMDVSKIISLVEKFSKTL
ncbi:MAG: dual specificity protein phosphatase family protein [Synergistaceae bacterium]|jgi:protein tyrosine/serine phosphatase|nr:dual specificity protein phosphatase family protein [Synergistaceae bacterium]